MFPNYPRLSPLSWKLTVSHTRLPTLRRQRCNEHLVSICTPRDISNWFPGSDNKLADAPFGHVDSNTLGVNVC